MRITFDPIKRDKTLAERGLDFADAAFVFGGVTCEVEDILAATMERLASSATACWPDAWSSLDTHRAARIAMSSA